MNEYAKIVNRITEMRRNDAVVCAIEDSAHKKRSS